MSVIDSLKEEVAYLRKENIIKTEIIKSLTEKNQVVVPVFLQNENSEPKVSTGNEHPGASSSLLAKENKDIKTMRKRNQN